MIERIADAGARASIVDDRLAVGHLASQGRGDRLTAAHGIGYLHIRIRERYVGLEAQHHARRKDVVVATLKPGQVHNHRAEVLAG